MRFDLNGVDTSALDSEIQDQYDIATTKSKLQHQKNKLLAAKSASESAEKYLNISELSKEQLIFKYKKPLEKLEELENMSDEDLERMVTDNKRFDNYAVALGACRQFSFEYSHVDNNSSKPLTSSSGDRNKDAMSYNIHRGHVNFKSQSIKESSGLLQNLSFEKTGTSDSSSTLQQKVAKSENSIKKNFVNLIKNQLNHKEDSSNSNSIDSTKLRNKVTSFKSEPLDSLSPDSKPNKNLIKEISENPDQFEIENFRERMNLLLRRIFKFSIAIMTSNSYKQLKRCIKIHETMFARSNVREEIYMEMIVSDETFQ